MNFKKILYWTLLVIIILVLICQIPAVNYRLGWRIDGAIAFLRGVVDPIGDLPKPNSQISDNLSPIPPPTQTMTAVNPTEKPIVIEMTPTMASSPTALPNVVGIDSIEWERQDWNNCGPATISMYLNFYGWEGDQFSVSDLIKPERVDRNVNVEELVHYTRNYAGWLNTIVRVGGNIELLKTFIANGIPVMIEEGDLVEELYWPNDDQWTGHYLLLTGYDDNADFFVAQDSFRGPDREVSFEKTDERWEAYNRVYILIYPPAKEELVKQILADDWDEETNRVSALLQTEEETKENPDNAFAWFNLGSNLVFYERYEEAAQAYDMARSIGIPQRMLRYQFGPFFAYFHANRNDELQTIIDYALRITDNSEEALLWRGWLLYRQGDQFGAVNAFREAYAANINSLDAQYALDFMGAIP
ncbi:MAG: hypothetical protein HON98_08595 [Chloroflexi bacterium]|jgi:tetratricopeptide (TPR) repeat protein|nr:hypothetical protein [Chloroflexota bacterium]MBT3668640.1 hypothetical protein [Chloroflexota bacterium]MBT4002011.1 hypothetical protein [Chloroflexota bacterium]MBT4304143.1 hypothetical protein [Chloroflexota bacterium]MBT4533223.1 hypothetical protein [Chloroflexota bacterium]